MLITTLWCLRRRDSPEDSEEDLRSFFFFFCFSGSGDSEGTFCFLAFPAEAEAASSPNLIELATVQGLGARDF